MLSARNQRKFFTIVAGVGMLATIFNVSMGTPRTAGTSLVLSSPAQPAQFSGPTLPPGPWDEGKLH